MQLSELRTFLAIIETGSLVRASERLNVTQSTVTARLKALESELGQTLIIRQKSGASLTAAGVKLQRYAATITDLWQQARRETALPHGYSSMHNFGCHHDLWQITGESIFKFITTTIPDAAVSVSTGRDETLGQWLNSGLIDMALTYRSHSNQNQASIPIMEDQLILVSTEANSPIRFNPKYIFVEAGEEFGRQHAAAYSDADTARISFNSAQLGLEYLLQNGGSAYLPQRLVQRSLDSQALHILADAPVFTRQSYITINKTARDSWTWFTTFLAHISKMPM